MKNKLILALVLLMLLVATVVTASAASYQVIEPAGSGTKYPVVFVMPEDGYTNSKDNTLAKLLQSAIKAGKGMDMLIVLPSFEKGEDLHAEVDAMIAEIDEKYSTTKSSAQRAIIGTKDGGYLAYALGMFDKDGKVPANGNFSFFASVNGNMLNNGWYSVYGDLYKKMTAAGTAAFKNRFSYLDAPVGGVWTNQEGSTADMAHWIDGNSLGGDVVEATIRNLKDGDNEDMDDFMVESANRIADRITNWVFSSGAATGSISLEKTVLLASEGNAKVNYTVKLTDALSSFVNGDVEMKIVVSVVDPETGDKLATKVVQTEKVSGAATFTGSASVANKVNGDSSNIVLSVKVLDTEIELAEATLIRGKSATSTAIDLMGDWHFEYAKGNPNGSNPPYSMSALSVPSGKATFENWSVVQPALDWWKNGFGNINPSTVGYPASWLEYFIIGNAYYARTFTVPANFATSDIMFSAGRVDDRCEVYINGVRIGGTGITEAGLSSGESAWEAYSAFPVDSSILNYGGENIVVLRNINDGMGGGGWYQGPVGLYAGAAFDAVNPDAYDPYFYEETFESKYAASLLGKPSPYDNPYLIYLPEDYYETDRYYPTVYLMHQYNSTHTSYKTDSVNDLFDAGVKEGLFDEFIVVIPNSQESSWWRGDWQKMVTEELVPHIDANYRTIKDARYRLTAGCSMGGQGAFGMALCNPDTFSGAISFFGAFSMGGNTSPLTVVKNESAEYMDNFAMYFCCGNQDVYSFGQPAIELNQALEAMGVDHYFFIDNGEHNSEFYLPHFNEAFEYVWSEMYDDAVLEGGDKSKENVKPNLRSMAYASLEQNNGTVIPVFAVNEGITKYYNSIPASSYTKNGTPALNIPLRITLTQNGKSYRALLRDNSIEQGVNVVVLDALTAEDFAPLGNSRNATALDLNKSYSVKIEGAIFDNDWVELKKVPHDLLAVALPNTGDNSNIVLLALVLAAAVSMMVVLKKKSRA
ncbi:MAG: LPXTG cell wall anchor domain-containing protein [Clostridia bacterium]|nr:LPXTG cell wall anchor domain-containing protein [Clostridia bacterium]